MSEQTPTTGPEERPSEGEAVDVDPSPSASEEDLTGPDPLATPAGPGEAPGPEPTEGAEDAEDAEDDQPDWHALAEQDPRSKGELLAELTEAEARRDEYLEDVRRARAEFDNYRKRVMREGTSQRQAGVADVAGKLLDVLDDFDRTIAASEGTEDEGLRKGVELVHGKLVEVLHGFGLTRIDRTDVPFDPTRHEAVQQVAADEPVDEPVVDQVLRPGYEIAGRVLRAAMVAVRQ